MKTALALSFAILAAFAQAADLSNRHTVQKRVDNSTCPGAITVNTTTVPINGAEVIVERLSCLLPLHTVDYAGGNCNGACDIECSDPNVSDAPDESDCDMVIAALKSLAADAPVFALPSAFVEQATYGTCTAYLKNTATGLTTDCWDSFAQQASLVQQSCMPGVCYSKLQIDGQSFWEVGIVNVES